MISLDQVKLLEAKVARAIEYVERVNSENIALVQREAELLAKLESSQKRTEELEALVLRFKEDQSRIEDGILAALDRLNQFEEAIEKSLEDKPSNSKPAKSSSAKSSGKTGDGLLAKGSSATEKVPAESHSGQPSSPSSEEMFFEIPEEETEEDIAEDLAGEDEEPKSKDSELDIF